MIVDRGLFGLCGASGTWKASPRAAIFLAKKIAALGEAFHVPLAPHNPNSPLSTIISAHVCSTIPNFLALEMYSPDYEPPWRDAITTPSVSSLVHDGRRGRARKRRAW